MKKINGVLGLIKMMLKYAAIVLIVIEILTFASEKIKGYMEEHNIQPDPQPEPIKKNVEPQINVEDELLEQPQN